jgi:hypothetical protein
MPSGKNWLHFVYVNLGFIVYTIGLYYVVSIQEIKQNWPLYRCNPMYMPLADNMQENFTYCVQSITTNLMGYLLQPLTFITSSLQTNMSSFTDEINSIRGMFSKIRDFISNIFQTVFGVFLNIIIEFQKIIIGLRDLFGKTIGIVTTVLFVVDGSLLTMQSAWNGPPGQLVRALGQCFHPYNRIRLQNGKVMKICELDLGDVLEKGGVVLSTMKIDNRSRENREAEIIYQIPHSGVDRDPIYVTGSHLVFDEIKGEFVQVKNHPLAVPTTLKVNWLTCLITSDHKIPIGSAVFWDWEDHFLKCSRKFVNT